DHDSIDVEGGHLALRSARGDPRRAPYGALGTPSAIRSGDHGGREPRRPAPTGRPHLTTSIGCPSEVNVNVPESACIPPVPHSPPAPSRSWFSFALVKVTTSGCGVFSTGNRPNRCFASS